MLFGVTVQTIYLLGGNNKFCKKNTLKCIYVIDDMKLRYSKTYLVYAEVKYVTIGEKTPPKLS